MVRVCNRVLVGLTGLALLVLGGSVLVGSLDLQRKWGFSLPSWWPFDGPRDVLLSDVDRTKWRTDGWWWPTVIAVLAVLVLLALWWLLAQLRQRRLTEVLVDSGDGEGALLRGRALESVLAGEAESLDGVSRAQVALTGKRNAPRARVGLVLEAHAVPAAALDGLSRDALAHARDSAGLDSLPAEVRLRAVRHRAQRVN